MLKIKKNKYLLAKNEISHALKKGIFIEVNFNAKFWKAI